MATRAPGSPTPRSQVEVAAGFLVLGLVSGAWIVSLSELKRVQNLSDGELGAILTAAALIALGPNFFAGSILQRWGRPVLPVAMLGAAIAFLLLSSLPTGLLLVLAIGLFRISFQITNACVNAAALLYEETTDKRVMANMHAAYSLGGVPGPLVAGAVLLHGGTLAWIYVALALLLAIFCLCLTHLSTALKAAHGERAPLFDKAILTNKPLLTIALITMIGAFGEGTMYTWTAIFLRDNLQTGVLAGSAGASVFFAAMAIGRLGIGTLLNRYTRLAVLTASGLAIVVGMSIALLATPLPVVLGGILVTGLAFAVTVPLAYSIAGSLTVGRSGGVAAFVTTLVSISGLLIPIVVGALANATSLRTALAIVPLIGAAIALGSLTFRRTPMAATLVD